MSDASEWVPSYGSIHALGHKQVLGITDIPVIVEEKIDGSQFSFGLYGEELRMRSKGAIIRLGDGNKMFAQAVVSVCDRVNLLHPYWTYRGEYLQKPKHNVLAYDRIPKGHIVLFDIMTEVPEDYLPYGAKAVEAKRIGLEVVPRMFSGEVSSIDTLRTLLDTVSMLGGTKVEGVVLKAYDHFTPDHHVMMAKFVSEAFKEVLSKEWKKANPGRGDVIATLVSRLRTEARWQKAVIHLRESGAYDGSPRDIGPLMKLVQQDVETEEIDRIKEALWFYFWPMIERQVASGLPEWYKERLAQEAFGESQA